MAYVKNYAGVWVNGSGGATPLTAAALNNLELQYDDAIADAATDATSKVSTHSALTVGVHGFAAGAIAAGDILYGSAVGVMSRRAKGSTYQRLVMDSAWAFPSWQDEIINLGAVIGNRVDVITAGLKLAIPMLVGMDLTEWSIVADQSGSIQLDLWVDTEANWPPTIADTIVASDHPKITTATKANGTALTGWTKAFASGTKCYLYINVDSCTSIKQITFVLTAKKRV